MDWSWLCKVNKSPQIFIYTFYINKYHFCRCCRMSDRVAGIEIVLHIRRGFCNFVEDTRFRDGKIIMPRADRNTLAKLQIINDNLGSLESLLISICVNTPQKSLSKEFFEDIILRITPRNRLKPRRKRCRFSMCLMNFSTSILMAHHCQATTGCLPDCCVALNCTDRKRLGQSLRLFSTTLITPR